MMVKVRLKKLNYIKELTDHLGCSVAVARKILRFFRVRSLSQKVRRPQSRLFGYIIKKIN